MKNLFKKIATIFSVVAVSMSMTCAPVSADELVEESPYYVAPGLDLTDEEVEEIIEKTYELGRAEGMSEEEIEEIVSVWYKQPEVSTFSARSTTTDNNSGYNAKQFFTTFCVEGGQTIDGSITFSLRYGLVRDDDEKPFEVTGYSEYDDDALDLSNAVYSQNPNGVGGSIFIYQYWFAISNLGSQTTSEGNIIRFDLSMNPDPDNNNNVPEGADAYEIIATESCIVVDDDELEMLECQLPGVDYNALNYNYRNYTVGAFGDIEYANGCGVINASDVQFLNEYIIRAVDIPNPIVEIAADVNKDGEIDILDLGLIRRYSTGGITQF